MLEVHIMSVEVPGLATTPHVPESNGGLKDLYLN